ncbi:MAG: signal peptidase I [Candidatus Levybacteria bacterium RIFCSPLOWO2_01_FULL_36_13]|nr:MAG: signal peptidase I [Candidatus Levybacteria bacterium RIFCSPHIGHO2_01_FULL_36_15b]OGH35593.1 MAG: signal peptidase I [Candidatus Levybacteria bacterium RIFCSPLOWO2_01_FULL_36_13]
MVQVLRKIYGFLIDSVQTFLIAAAIFLVIYLFLFRPYEVKGDSMYPNFYDKEYVLTNLILLKFQAPKMGDVVVFKSPVEPEKDYIKRIIGLPGDSIYIKDGDVYLNGEMLNEGKYLNSSVKTHQGAFLQNDEQITVPENMYFVLGDNRDASSDSREWGFVKKDSLIGVSMFVYLPINKMRIVANPY